MKSQRNAQGIALHLLSDPPPPLFFYFHHHNQLLCNSAIDVIFPILFCCNNFYCIYVCPHNLLLQHTFFSLCLCVGPSIMLSMSSPLAIQHICIWYLISLAQFIVLSNIPQSVSFLNFSFAFASLLSCTWLQHRLFFFHPPPPMPYSLYIDSDSACCIFHPL